MKPIVGVYAFKAVYNRITRLEKVIMAPLIGSRLRQTHKKAALVDG